MENKLSKLEPDHLKVNLIILLLSILIGAIALTVVWAIGELETKIYLIALAVVLFLYILSRLFVKAQFNRFSYFMDERGLFINKGVFWQRRIVVPINRVQHTDITQGPLARRYNLAELTVNTAGTTSASVKINGISYDNATNLRSQLSFAETDGAV